MIAFAISLSVFAALRPYLLKLTVDNYIKTHDGQGLLLYIVLMGVVLMLGDFVADFILCSGPTGSGKILSKTSA
ncbi:MAG: hypothetical protein U0X58_08565 [Flavobacteriaceae bacterium]